MQNSDRINEQTLMLTNKQIAQYENGQLGSYTKNLSNAENLELFRELLEQYEAMAVFAAMLMADDDAERAETILGEGYGCYSDVIEWAENVVLDIYHEELKSTFVQTYFDYEQWAYDALLNNDWVAVDTPEGVYIFDGGV